MLPPQHRTHRLPPLALTQSLQAAAVKKQKDIQLLRQADPLVLPAIVDAKHTRDGCKLSIKRLSTMKFKEPGGPLPSTQIKYNKYKDPKAKKPGCGVEPGDAMSREDGE